MTASPQTTATVPGIKADLDCSVGHRPSYDLRRWTGTAWVEVLERLTLTADDSTITLTDTDNGDPTYHTRRARYYFVIRAFTEGGDR